VTPERRADALRSAFDQDTLRVISHALYYTLGAGRMASAERALARPVMLALLDAIDEPRGAAHDRPMAGRRLAGELAVVPRELVELLTQNTTPQARE
jgi:hypothetical protein